MARSLPTPLSHQPLPSHRACSRPPQRGRLQLRPDRRCHRPDHHCRPPGEHLSQVLQGRFPHLRLGRSPRLRLVRFRRLRLVRSPRLRLRGRHPYPHTPHNHPRSSADRPSRACALQGKAAAHDGGIGRRVRQAAVALDCLKTCGTPRCVPGRGAGSPRDVLHVPPVRAATPRDEPAWSMNACRRTAGLQTRSKPPA